MANGGLPLQIQHDTKVFCHPGLQTGAEVVQERVDGVWVLRQTFQDGSLGERLVAADGGELVALLQHQMQNFFLPRMARVVKLVGNFTNPFAVIFRMGIC